MKKITVGVVFGGRSGEHEVSKLSARSVIPGLQTAGFKVVPIFIDKKGCWHVHDQEVFLSPTPGVGLRTSKTGKKILVDVFFPVLHGTFGEDGTIQGLFELAAVPYAGAGVLGSAIGMDKEAQKLLYLLHGIQTPQFEVIRLPEWQKDQNACLRRAERLGYPSFVKPVNLGSSVGVSKVKAQGALKRAILQAFQYDTKVLVEEFVQGREIDCGVLGNDAPRVSLPGEVIPKREFFDYRAKYVADDTVKEYAIALPEHLKDKIMRTAAKVFEVTFCEGFARVEFLLTKSGDLFTIEINTIPGCTSHSLVSKLWESSGVPFSDLMAILVRLAMERWERKRALKTSFNEGRLLERS